MNKEEGIKIFNVVEEIKGYQKEIAKLKEENKQLKDKLYESERKNNELEQDGQDIAKELSIRIDKAIEYIENRYDYEQNALMHTFSRDNLKELYEILKGDSNE